MAEVNATQDDSDGKKEQDEEGIMDMDGSTGARESVSIAEMEACLETGNAFNRELVARVILETLRCIPVPDLRDDLSRVLSIISRLADDPEPSVRAELMEQVPHVAMFCHEEKGDQRWMHLIPSFLLPLVVRYLTDVNNQVRKTAQAALLVLLEQNLVERSDVEEQVCPLLLMLTNPDSHDDFRTEAVALMSRMAPLLGGVLSRRVFLERFAALCDDTLFHVRKICAANFGEFCAVVGSEVTETVLLTKFHHLCGDDLWGVRKACAEVFMSVSRSVSMATRRNQLAPLFVNLLQDESRWVRMAAFQALGPFISTFSTSDSDEEVIDQRQEQPMDLETPEFDQMQPTPAPEISFEEQRAVLYPTPATPPPVASAPDEEFNAFHYWREPLVEVPLPPAAQQESVDIVEKALEELMAQVELGASSKQEQQQQHHSQEQSDTVHAFDLRRVACQELLPGTPGVMNDLSKPVASPEEITATGFHSNVPSTLASPTRSSYSNLYHSHFPPRRRSDGTIEPPSDTPMYSPTPSVNEASQHVQNVVPQPLMDHYLIMTDPYYVDTVDSEITRHCAFSLPAVACTLGPDNWPLLRELYDTLASDMQWKVRRTLASSIHEIGAIMGQEVVTKDLVPVFDGFIKDLDEVRIGILKHLSDFLKLLPESDRREYLPRLPEFLRLDNEQNWRFRQELALQLQAVAPLFSSADTAQFILPLALSLAGDRVAAVRIPAFQLVSQILKQLGDDETSDEESSPRNALLNELVTRFCAGARWILRQSFVGICSQLLRDQSIAYEEFAERLLNRLLGLRWDRVPNVRLVLARVVNRQLKNSEFYSSIESSYQEAIESTLVQLAADEDRDVRYFATCKVSEEPEASSAPCNLPNT